MQKAMIEAGKALVHDDVPVGALVVMGNVGNNDVGKTGDGKMGGGLDNGKIIVARHNERELLGDPTAHAEMLAIADAAKVVGSWRLDGAVLVSTLEPCPMCAGAAYASRISKVVFGAFDPKAGACGSLYNLGADTRLNHTFEVVGGVLEEECSALLTKFFAGKRN